MFCILLFHVILSVIFDQGVRKGYEKSINNPEKFWEEIANEFGKHSSDEHGIEYSIETITKFILNKSTE